MRFRLLSDIELKELSEDFTQFLVVQGIDDETWRKINIENKEKALQIVEIFSDTVLLKVYSKVKFMSFTSEKVFSVFKVKKDAIDLILLKSTDPKLVFNSSEPLEDLINRSIGKWELYSSSKKLGDKVPDEVHQLTLQGCQIESPGIWDALSAFQKKAVKKASF
tara:strand:+ start:76 stop:567 length:492 start_codon:yes stop_codon:yes gene_type:complete